mgnify:CR=1 FL=1
MQQPAAWTNPGREEKQVTTDKITWSTRYLNIKMMIRRYYNKLNLASSLQESNQLDKSIDGGDMLMLLLN